MYVKSLFLMYALYKVSFSMDTLFSSLFISTFRRDIYRKRTRLNIESTVIFILSCLVFPLLFRISHTTLLHLHFYSSFLYVYERVLYNFH